MRSRLDLLFILVLLMLLLLPVHLHADAPRYRVALITVHGKTGETIEESTARRALQAMGIPYDVVAPSTLNAEYPVAILPGPLYNGSLSPAQREAVYRFVSSGGLLMATQIEGSEWFPLFGIERAAVGRDRFRIRFSAGVEDGWLRYLDHPNEREISLGDPKVFTETIWTIGYAIKDARVLAQFTDGAGAVVVNDYDAGQALALGVSLSQAVLLAQVGQGYEAGRQWINSFEPSGDVFLLLLKGLYESSARPAIFWHTVPRGLETAIVLTHDVDTRESFVNSVTFAGLAQRYGVRSTFFVTTKIFQDEEDIGYYDASRIPFIAEAKALGAEIGSHSFSHSRRFAKFPMGSASVTAKTYRPNDSPTILGEVQASKELLDRDLPGQQTVSFRAGELAFPPRLIEALNMTGYHYDSTFSANNVITNFPFFAFERNELGAHVTNLVEIPVTVDDSQGYLTRETRDQVVRTWTEIIEGNRANGAMTCILIHPTDVTYKLEVLERLLKRYSRENVWIGNVAALGEFWARRVGIDFRLAVDVDRLTVHLTRKADALGSDLALVVAGTAKEVRILDRDGQEVPYRTIQLGGKYLLVLQPVIQKGH